jgi:hypothetical protein
MVPAETSFRWAKKHFANVVELLQLISGILDTRKPAAPIVGNGGKKRHKVVGSLVAGQNIILDDCEKIAARA